jgi:hypothetical protein
LGDIPRGVKDETGKSFFREEVYFLLSMVSTANSKKYFTESFAGTFSRYFWNDGEPGIVGVYLICHGKWREIVKISSKSVFSVLWSEENDEK